MEGVTFRYFDAVMLYCIPAEGCNLEELVLRYTCLDRSAVPSYEMVSTCLRRAIRAGFMPLPTGETYKLTPDWHERIHRRDEELMAAELALIEFADELESRRWPEIGDSFFVLDRDDYQQAAQAAGFRLDELLGSD